METVLELKRLTKRIRGKIIVEDLSLTVNKGEIFGLLGPNGAGKTTTIRMIVGLMSKTRGDVMICGIDTDENFTQAMTQIGAIVENPEMYKFLSGYKNLIHFARMSRTNVSRERIDEVVKLVELEDAIHKKVKTYSLGMRQRLGVAQAILHNPSLLILDEPTNGLDPQGIYEFRTYLKELTKEGTSVIVSSHLLSEMQLMCDRVAIIQKGKLINISTVNELTDDDEGNVTIKVDVTDPNAAQTVLSEKYHGMAISKQENSIQMSIPKEEISKINETLVKAGVTVEGINIQKQTLEERFLEITKEGENK